MFWIQKNRLKRFFHAKVVRFHERRLGLNIISKLIILLSQVIGIMERSFSDEYAFYI